MHGAAAARHVGQDGGLKAGCALHDLGVHALYVTAGPDKLDPPWDWGETRYEIVIEGDPSTELTLKGVRQPDGTMSHPGYDWTAMGAINAIPDVCDAAPGWINHLDLGLIRPRGLVRP